MNQKVKPVPESRVTKPIFSIAFNTELMAENPVKISVIMPVYNADRFLEASIESIINQTYRNFELIIICSSPTDETRRILTTYQESDERVTVTYQEKKGIIFARNSGCLQAKGEYISVMDADDVSVPDRFELQAAFLEKHPDVGIVCSWADYMDEGGRVFKKVHPPATSPVIGWYLFFGDCIVHSTAMIRSEVLKKVGYYTPGKKGFPEDYDLWIRAFQVTKLANIPRPLVKYRMHTSNNSISVLTEIQQFCIPLQIALVEKLLDEYHHPMVKEIDIFRNSPVFSFNYPINDKQVDLIETLYALYLTKYSLSNSEINEIRAQISQTLLLYSWSMFHFSKGKSLNLFLQSLKYSMTGVIKKFFFVLWRELKHRTGISTQVTWEKK